MAWTNLANLFRRSSHDFCQLYCNIKQRYFIFLCFCTVIDHRWRHSVWRTKSHGARLRLVRTFLFYAHYDVICDLLQYGRTQKWNRFVKYYLEQLWILNQAQWSYCSNKNYWNKFLDQKPITRKSSRFLYYCFYVFINPLIIVLTAIALDRTGVMLVYWRDGKSPTSDIRLLENNDFTTSTLPSEFQHENVR